MRDERDRQESAQNGIPSSSDTAPPGRQKSFRTSDPTSELGMLSELTGFALRRAQLLVFARFAQSVGDKTVTPQRFAMLELIGTSPGLQQAQLAGALVLSPPAATVTIDYWEERGCVERRSEPRDRRSNGIHITPHGREVLTALEQQVLAHDRELTARLTDGEIEELRRLLAKVYSED
jgi:DNA-binding MarR family transcriptional regulator